MEIKISESDIPHIARLRYSKFVLARTGTGEVLSLFNGNTKHIDNAPKNSPDLIGAGLVAFSMRDVIDDAVVRWGSDTILNEFGFDRPEDENEAEKIAADIRKTVIEWAKSQPSFNES